MDLWLELILGTLVVYYITSMIVGTTGPFNMFMKLRHATKNTPFECFVCTAFWVSLVTALVMFGVHDWVWVLPFLAMAGGALALDRATE